MPLILIKRDKSEVSDQLFSEILKELPRIVAEELSISDPRGQLISADIKIWPFEKKLMDVGEKVLQVVIIANDYPERLDLLKIKGEQIREALSYLIPVSLFGKCFVWVLLAPGFFAEF